MIGDLTINLQAVVSDFVAPIKQAHSGLQTVSNSATEAQFHIDTMARSMLSLSSSANSLGFVSQHLAAIGSFSGMAAKGLTMVSAGVGFVGGVAFRTAAAMSLLLIPLEGLMMTVNAVLAPFKFLISLIIRVGQAAITAAKPLLSLAFFAFQVKVAISSLSVQFKLITKFLGMLSPKLRLVVLGLTALGLAGRAGGVAMGLLSSAIKAGTVVVLAFTNPLAALKVVATSTAMAIFQLSTAALKAVRSLGTLAVSAVAAAGSGLKQLGASVLSVTASLAGGFIGALASAAKWLAMIGIAGAGWGIALAANAEQTEVAFTTMLKSAGAARQVLGELEEFAASTPFQLNDLQDGAKQLLNAQVPTAQLTDKLRMLGDIAAGTGKPILDFARIYSKVKSTGKVSLETLNQLAERGVPIYSALQEQLGVSRTKMLDMISKGKIGFQDLDAAITATATGTGVFAGGMAAQSQTVAGLFSTLKDNVSFAMRELGQVITDAFDFKGLLATGITFFQRLRAGIAEMQPVFFALAGVVKAAFSAIWEVGSVIFNSLSNAMGTAGGDIMATLMETLAVVQWVFESWPDLAELAFTKMGLFAVQAFSQIQHFFVAVIPALLTWFIDNWQSIFFTAADFVLTVFINIGKNMRAIWSGLMSFFSGNGFNVDFTPLTEGFRSTVSELPDIPDRAIGELEKNLVSRVEGLNNKVAGSLQQQIEKNLGSLEAFRNRTPEELTGEATLPDKMEEEGTGGAGSNKQSLGVMERGSSEAFKAIFGGQNKGQIAEQKKANSLLKTIAKNTGKKPGGDGPELQIQEAV